MSRKLSIDNGLQSQMKKHQTVTVVLNNINIISKMDKIRRTYLTLSDETIKPMTIKEFYASIERAEEDIKSGRVYTQEEVEKESENW